MVLKAIGKWIDTMPISDLLSQEESCADTIIFEVDRFHSGWDLAEFVFCLRGVTESGGETQSELSVEKQEDILRLYWNVNDKFTTEAGRLSLDLYASRYAEGADPETDAPICILRYQLPPVQVRGLPESDTILDSHSYTDFLLQVKAAANDAIAAINSIITEFEAQLPAYDEKIAAVEATLDTHDAAIKQTAATAAENKDNIQQLQTQVDGLMPIVALTQEEFDALENVEDDVLYVVKSV